MAGFSAPAAIGLRYRQAFPLPWPGDVHGHTHHIVAKYESGTLARKLVYGPEIDEPLMMFVGENRYFYHANELGSVLALSNASGALAETYLYSPYGELGFGGALGNPYLYTGRRHDPETGLYYYRPRMYSATQRRFLQPDPIGYAGGLKMCAYVGNNPVMFMDPWGLAGFAFDAGGGYGTGWGNKKHSDGGSAATGLYVGVEPESGSREQMGGYVAQSYTEKIPGACLGLGINGTYYKGDSRDFFKGNMNYSMGRFLIVSFIEYTDPRTGETTGWTISLFGKGIGLTGVETGTSCSWSSALQE